MIGSSIFTETSQSCETPTIEVPEQPPPGPDQLEELPPEGWRGISPQEFWLWVVGGVVLIFLFALTGPMFQRSPKAAERTWALSNAKQIGLVLLAFDQDYGSYPHETTVAEVKRTTMTPLDLSGSSSNAMFRQLIAFGAGSEAIFCCKHPEGIRKPDGVMHRAGHSRRERSASAIWRA